MKILYIGGTGEVSYGCIEAGLELGQQISVYNRGASGVTLPTGTRHIPGDVTDEATYQAVGKQKWDAVCQFRSFDMQQCERDIRAFAGNVGQFVFISTAMVYQRPPAKLPITESRRAATRIRRNMRRENRHRRPAHGIAPLGQNAGGGRSTQPHHPHANARDVHRG